MHTLPPHVAIPRAKPSRADTKVAEIGVNVDGEGVAESGSGSLGAREGDARGVGAAGAHRGVDVWHPDNPTATINALAARATNLASESAVRPTLRSLAWPSEETRFTPGDTGLGLTRFDGHVC